VFTQQYFGLLQMPGAPRDFFPVDPTFIDGLLVVSLITVLGLCISYFPPKILVKTLFKQAQ
jgi:hypothetical protein